MISFIHSFDAWVLPSARTTGRGRQRDEYERPLHSMEGGGLPLENLIDGADLSKVSRPWPSTW